MKKVIFSFAIAAMALFSLPVYASQGDDVSNEAEEKVVPIDEQTELECDKYLLKVPEGFKARSRMVNNSCNMGMLEPPYVTVSVSYNWRNPDSFKEDAEESGYEAIDDITVGDVTYHAYYWLNKKDQNCQHVKVATPHGSGVIDIHFFTGSSRMDTDEAKEVLMDVVKTVLDNMTIKK